MKKTTKTVLAVCLTVLLVIGIGGYAYVSDYYHADEIAMEATGRRMATVFQLFRVRNRFGKPQMRSRRSSDSEETGRDYVAVILLLERSILQVTKKRVCNTAIHTQIQS